MVDRVMRAYGTTARANINKYIDGSENFAGQQGEEGDMGDNWAIEDTNDKETYQARIKQGKYKEVLKMRWHIKYNKNNESKATGEENGTLIQIYMPFDSDVINDDQFQKYIPASDLSVHEYELGVEVLKTIG